jgi:hypothetical protein
MNSMKRNRRAERASHIFVEKFRRQLITYFLTRPRVVILKRVSKIQDAQREMHPLLGAEV